MIPNLIPNSRNTEISGVTTQIIQGFGATTLNTDPNMEFFFNELNPLSVKYLAAIKRMKVQSETKLFDEIRDDRLIALFYLVMSFSKHPTPKIKNAALYLLKIFENYGLEIRHESLTRESALLNSLLADLAEEEAQENIGIVPQCNTYIAALQAAQNNFDGNRLAYEEAQGEEGTQENASAMKKQVVNIINKKIKDYLNVMIQVNEARYGAYTRTVAEIIAANNEIVKKRRNKGDTLVEGE